ncbi:siderophore ferric iron reductase [Sphingomonas sp. NCPPB 2930]
MGDLLALLATAARAVPGLDGRPGRCAVAWCDAPAHEVAVLAEHLTRAHPEAGPHYWSLRCWGLCIWQAIYLSVVGVHLCGRSPRLSALAQTVEDGRIRGFTLAPHPLPRQDEDRALASGAEQIGQGCARLLSGWCAVGPLAPKAAGRLQADCVLGAVLAMRRHRRDWSAARTAALGQQWLAAMGLAGECGLLAFTDAAGAPQLALARKGCCLHYRRAGAEMCATCPRMRVDERLARLGACAP